MTEIKMMWLYNPSTKDKATIKLDNYYLLFIYSNFLSRIDFVCNSEIYVGFILYQTELIRKLEFFMRELIGIRAAIHGLLWRNANCILSATANWLTWTADCKTPKIIKSWYSEQTAYVRNLRGEIPYYLNMK